MNINIVFGIVGVIGTFTTIFVEIHTRVQRRKADIERLQRAFVYTFHEFDILTLDWLYNRMQCKEIYFLKSIKTFDDLCVSSSLPQKTVNLCEIFLETLKALQVQVPRLVKCSKDDISANLALKYMILRDQAIRISRTLKNSDLRISNMEDVHDSVTWSKHLLKLKNDTLKGEKNEEN